MGFVVDRLQDLIDQKETDLASNKGEQIGLYKIAYLDGLRDARQHIVRAEAELEKRIWDAWRAEGVEPK